MPDHEPDFLGLPIQNMQPMPDIPAMAPVPSPFQPMPGAMPVSDTAVLSTPVVAAPPPQPIKQLAQFQYLHEGKTYQATIYQDAGGVDISLVKLSGGQWVPSLSRMKHGILGAYLYQAYAKAMADATKAAADKAALALNAPQTVTGTSPVVTGLADPAQANQA
jgi:hypothetical protein